MVLPVWLTWLLTAAMIAVTGYHLTRLVVPIWRRRCPVAAHVTHAGMGATMTVMLAGALSATLAFWLGAVFGAVAAGFAGHAVRGYLLHGATRAAPQAWQVPGPLAMSAMLLASAEMTSAMDGSAGMTAAATGPRTLATGVAVAAAAALVIRSLVRPRAVASGGPLLSAGCQAAMGVATICMVLAT